MFKVIVYTPNGIYMERDATSINIMTNDGRRGILQEHMPIVTPLVISRFEVYENEKKDFYSIGQGMLFFKNNVANVIVESIEHKSEIDLDRAINAKNRALSRIENNLDGTDVKRARAALSKAINRITLYNYNPK